MIYINTGISGRQGGSWTTNPICFCIRVTAGSRGQSAPWGFSPGNFCWPTEEREARKKGKMENKRWKIAKGKLENWKWTGKKYENGQKTFFFFPFIIIIIYLFIFFKFVSFFFFLFIYLFIYLFFCFSLFETSETCFGSTKLKIFYQDKAFHASGKNQEKWLCLLWKIFLLYHWEFVITFICNHSNIWFTNQKSMTPNDPR